MLTVNSVAIHTNLNMNHIVKHANLNRAMQDCTTSSNRTESVLSQQDWDHFNAFSFYRPITRAKATYNKHDRSRLAFKWNIFNLYMMVYWADWKILNVRSLPRSKPEGIVIPCNKVGNKTSPKPSYGFIDHRAIVVIRLKPSFKAEERAIPVLGSRLSETLEKRKVLWSNFRNITTRGCY